jgi:serine/threonine-protein kinase
MNVTPMKAREVFLAAVKMSPGAWPAYLAEVCDGDEVLRRRVANLLEAHLEAGSFLSPDAPLPTATVDEPTCERAGTVIGPYRLVEQIGEGGMGLVFVAEQQHPVRRKVALKVIKPGMDSRQVVARFEAERQALALMDHPNIAKVHDGGETDSGRPYFVMELVKGVPITEFCDQNQIPIPQRLELFLSVTQAVQHAHQKGIIHRDIKPSNVLVMSPDGTPVVKVIDFGIAKAIGQHLTDKTIYTQFAQLVGTPLYMSPEQAGESSLDVDTRSDIYSLGVLLYELLTGTTPFTQERMRQADYDEIRRIIREEEPPKPSTRISTLGQAAATVSAQRKSDPRRLSQVVRGELDWIVMKCLEKDRNRRYESASAFAADILRHLADEPVQAHAPSAGYRLRKYARRNRVGLTMTGLILLSVALLAGGVGSVIHERTAREGKVASDLEQALEQAELFQKTGKREEALGAFNQAVLLSSDVRPDPVRDARLAELKGRLDAEVRDQEFMAQIEDIRLRVQSGVNLEESHFTPDAALPEIQEALRRYGIVIGEIAPEQAAARVQLRPEPVRRSLIAALDECLRWVPAGKPRTRSWLLATLTAADNDAWRIQARRARAHGDWKALEQLAREADLRKQPPSFLIVVAKNPALKNTTRLRLLRRIQRVYPADLWANHGLAWALQKHGQPAEAVRYYTAALALRPNSPGIYVNRGLALTDAGEVDSAIEDYRQAITIAPQYATAHNNLGIALKLNGQLDSAIAAYREAIRIKRNAATYTNLGIALEAKGQVDEAIAVYRVAIRLDNRLPEARYNLGDALFAAGKVDEAIAEYREAIRLRTDYAEAHVHLGTALKKKHRLDEAIAEYREAIRLNKELHVAHHNLGRALYAKGRWDEAIAEYRETIRIKKDYAPAHMELGVAFYRKSQLDEAIGAFRDAIGIKRDYVEAHTNLGNALLARGRLDEAIAEHREAIRLRKEDPAAHYSLGAALCRKGRLEEAIAQYREAIRIKNDHFNAYYNLGTTLCDMGRWDEAITEFRGAIRIKKDFAEAYYNLGMALQKLGEFGAAVEPLRRAHEFGSGRPGWRDRSAQRVRECERRAELERRLPALLEGKATPAGPDERIELAEVCALKRLNRAAARFYEEAFAARPRLADDLDASRRYNAACAAALAGCGQGKDAAKLAEHERARLRGQALNWLRADLEAWRRLLEIKPEKVPSATRVAQVLQSWLADPDFARVRESEALAKLPEAERQAWQKLWQEVADTLK